MKHFSRVTCSGEQLSHLFHVCQHISDTIALAGHVIDTHIVDQQPECHRESSACASGESRGPSARGNTHTVTHRVKFYEGERQVWALV